MRKKLLALGTSALFAFSPLHTASAVTKYEILAGTLFLWNQALSVVAQNTTESLGGSENSEVCASPAWTDFLLETVKAGGVGLGIGLGAWFKDPNNRLWLKQEAFLKFNKCRRPPLLDEILPQSMPGDMRTALILGGEALFSLVGGDNIEDVINGSGARDGYKFNIYEDKPKKNSSKTKSVLTRTYTIRQHRDDDPDVHNDDETEASGLFKYPAMHRYLIKKIKESRRFDQSKFNIIASWIEQRRVRPIKCGDRTLHYYLLDKAEDVNAVIIVEISESDDGFFPEDYLSPRSQKKQKKDDEVVITKAALIKKEKKNDDEVIISKTSLTKKKKKVDTKE